MAVRVVDASAICALLFGEPDADRVAAALSGARLVAPALLRFEVANTCLKKIRRHPELRDELLRAFQMLYRAAIETVDFDDLDVLRLAEARGLTAYDASYLWLADRLGGELVSLDRRLQEATSRPG